MDQLLDSVAVKSKTSLDIACIKQQQQQQRVKSLKVFQWSRFLQKIEKLCPPTDPSSSSTIRSFSLSPGILTHRMMSSVKEITMKNATKSLSMLICPQEEHHSHIPAMY
nr:uncharacterized protein LOC112489270 isoform X2 [Ziziphus jujuba var. spinosa]